MLLHQFARQPESAYKQEKAQHNCTGQKLRLQWKAKNLSNQESSRIFLQTKKPLAKCCVVRATQLHILENGIFAVVAQASMVMTNTMVTQEMNRLTSSLILILLIFLAWQRRPQPSWRKTSKPKSLSISNFLGMPCMAKKMHSRQRLPNMRNLATAEVPNEQPLLRISTLGLVWF